MLGMQRRRAGRPVTRAPAPPQPPAKMPTSISGPAPSWRTTVAFFAGVLTIVVIAVVGAFLVAGWLYPMQSRAPSARLWLIGGAHD